MHLLVCLEVEEQCVQRTKVVQGIGGVRVEDHWEGEAEQKEICCSLGESSCVEAWESIDIRSCEQ